MKCTFRTWLSNFHMSFESFHSWKFCSTQIKDCSHICRITKLTFHICINVIFETDVSYMKFTFYMRKCNFTYKFFFTYEQFTLNGRNFYLCECDRHEPPYSRSTVFKCNSRAFDFFLPLSDKNKKHCEENFL